MPERAVPFSLLDAARVVARGGGLDESWRPSSAQARAPSTADAVAILLHDADAGLLLSFDGLVCPGHRRTWTTELARAVADRVPVDQRRGAGAAGSR